MCGVAVNPEPCPEEAALEKLLSLLDEINAARAAGALRLTEVHPDFQASADNLLAYLCLRRHDIRPLQQRLAALGLSSLGRSEGYVVSAIETLVQLLERLLGREGDVRRIDTPDMASSEQLRLQHAQRLFGAARPNRGVRIMVTVPSEAAHDHELVRLMLRNGMDCMRINCAHDERALWSRMIENLRLASEEEGRPCRVVMDLAGPKLRTGPIEAGPAVRRVRPRRDELGRVVQPARILLRGDSCAMSPAVDAVFDVAGEWLMQLVPGEEVLLRDARGARRRLRIVEVFEGGCLAELMKTAYIVPGLRLERTGAHARRAGKTRIGDFPPSEKSIRLDEGDLLILTDQKQAGRPASYDEHGEVIDPARIGCTLEAALEQVRPGEAVWFDDGKIGGVIEDVAARQVRVRITHAAKQARLRSDRGINLPDSGITSSALTAQDLKDLRFAARHADIVELSFANSVADVNALIAQLEKLKATHLGVVLKIETRHGFENLPAMLLAGMKLPVFGVMIARGDLAVEVGFERLAELQEEILCLCEAAHVPVIWATQVLERLAKTGKPSRSEITDAAAGVRAECVMLNKGAHIVEAVGLLDRLLTRMQAHRSKKRDLLRRLKVADTLG